jgi:hypothetical protein
MQKIPHFQIHKPKTVVVDTVLVMFVYVGDPLYINAKEMVLDEGH